MHKTFKRIKTTIIGGIVAVSALAAPFVAPTANKVPSSLSADAASDGENYAKLLQYSLYFYDANMCGDKVSSRCALDWRGNCHTGDDVNGGFHDAGDHVMFGLPQGYAASTLGWAYYEFSDAFKATGQDAHLKVITDHFCEFFRGATKLNGNSVSQILIEKGEGNDDHSYWGPPETQGNNRAQLWVSNGSGDIAAEYAASLAANYINFGNADDLKYAKALYDYAKRNPGATSRAPFYEDESAADEISWAACWLYLATKDNTYMNDVKSIGTSYWIHCWGNVSLGAAILKGEITGDWSAASGYLGNFSGDKYYFLQKWGSARYNAQAQMCTLVADKYGHGNAAWAKGQMQYLTGDKAFNNGQTHCLVVGFKPNASSKPHHRAASGTNTAESDGTPSAHSLIGALCGGPTDENGTYADLRSDFIGNEVALDYNVGLVGAAAGLYSKYKTGSIDTSITGVTKIYNGSSQPDNPTTTTTTTTKNNYQPITTTTTKTNTDPSTPGKYVYEPAQKVVFDQNAEEKMVGWNWSDIGVKSGEKVTKVEVKISSSSNIGSWSGAFGTSTSESPDYWTMTENMSENISGNSGTITWNVPSSTSAIIQTQGKDAVLKFGTWWVNCSDFTIDSVTVYTDGTGTQPVTTTTTKKVTTTTTTTTKTNPGVNVSLYGDADCNGTVKMNDAVLILQVVTNPDRFGVNGYDNSHITEKGMANANCCKPDSTGVTANDALAVQRKLLGLISLPTNS